MHAVLGIIKVKTEHLDAFVEHVRTHASHSVREPGCLRFDVLQDRDDLLTICLYEVFRSEADLDIHRRQDYYKRWMEMSRDWRDASSCTRRVLNYISPREGEHA